MTGAGWRERLARGNDIILAVATGPGNAAAFNADHHWGYIRPSDRVDIEHLHDLAIGGGHHQPLSVTSVRHRAASHPGGKWPARAPARCATSHRARPAWLDVTAHAIGATAKYPRMDWRTTATLRQMGMVCQHDGEGRYAVCARGFAGIASANSDSKIFFERYRPTKCSDGAKVTHDPLFWRTYTPRAAHPLRPRMA